MVRRHRGAAAEYHHALCQCAGPQGPGSAHERRRSGLIRALKSGGLRQSGWRHFCDDSGIARRAMFRIIKAVTGYTPVKFQMRYRVLKAQELLRTTDQSVSEIAARCGFMNAARLSESYKRHFTYPPTHERRLSQRLLVSL